MPPTAQDVTAFGVDNANRWRHRSPVEPDTSHWALPTSAPPAGTDIVAIGADLEPGTLLHAYRVGLFPMPFDRRRIAWFSPDPRGVLPLDRFRVSRSLRRSTRRFDVTMNHQFRDVVAACANPERTGAWINNEFIDAYERLHRSGWAHSIEVYRAGSEELVGGLYGVQIEGFFAGESMFHTATDASKVALVYLVAYLQQCSTAPLLDVQWTTSHLASLGAVDIERHRYIPLLHRALDPANRIANSPETILSVTANREERT